MFIVALVGVQSMTTGQQYPFPVAFPRQNLMASMMKRTTQESERDATPDVFKGKVKKPDLGVDKPKPDSPQSRHQRLSKDKGHEPDA